LLTLSHLKPRLHIEGLQIRMHARGSQYFIRCRSIEVLQYLGSHLRGPHLADHIEGVAAVVDLHAQPPLDLAQVFVQWTT
jgi:hypothetical protein